MEKGMNEKKVKTMKNDIQGNITGAAVWANFTEWFSGISLAVSGFARIDDNKARMCAKKNAEHYFIKNSGGQKIRKPVQALGWRISKIKKQGFFEKSIRDNITGYEAAKNPHSLFKHWAGTAAKTLDISRNAA